MDYRTLSFIVSAVVVLVAAAIDAREHRIPNWLVGPYLLIGLALRWVMEGRGGLWESLAAVSLALLATVPIYLLGGLGMGDCKLLAAVGVWLGLYQTVYVLFGTAMAGGILAVLFASRQGQLGRALRSTFSVVTDWTQHGIRRNREVSLDNPSAIAMPYGPAIAAGVFFSFLYV
jgi:prepilin peptidase CpaA